MRLLRSRTKSLSLSPPDWEEEEEVEIWVDKVTACSAAFLVTQSFKMGERGHGESGLLIIVTCN